MGLFSNGMVYTEVIPNASSAILQNIIYDLVEIGSTIITDGWKGYNGLAKDFTHKIINHTGGIYVQDGYHTNAIEGFWSQHKRGIFGIYHFVSSKHLSKDCEEFAYRYNTRKMSDGERFNQFLKTSIDRLQYWDLIY